MNERMPTQPKIDLKQTTPFFCDNCGHNVFHEAIMFRKVSALLSGTGKEGLAPIPVFACAKCGFTNDMFIPQEIRNNIVS